MNRRHQEITEMIWEKFPKLEWFILSWAGDEEMYYLQNLEPHFHVSFLPSAGLDEIQETIEYAIGVRK